jgi:endonuclease YncB( thermonuclease family)
MGNCFIKEIKNEEKEIKNEEKEIKNEEKEIKNEEKEIKNEEKEINKEEIEINKIVKEIDLYKDCTDENTPYYSYENLKKKIKILRVIDGDTVDIALHHDETGKIFKYRVRLYGIDTPEKRPLKSNPNRDKEIAASKRSSEALIKILEENDNIVVSLFYKPDKYGRLLCTLYDKNGEDINKWMVANGYAYEYFGKTKQKYKEDSE